MTQRTNFFISVVYFSMVMLMGYYCLWAANSSTIDVSDKYAYGANIAWVDFRPEQPSAPEGIVVGERFLYGQAYSANCGWISLGDGSPEDGVVYGNDSATDFGVNRDEMGNLSGYAYGANIGWINFGWTDISHADRPRIDPDTGVFYGYAYSANVGWINLGAGYLSNDTIAVDIDEDGIADDWEYVWMGGLLTSDMNSDQDGDGCRDQVEAMANTDPLDASEDLKVVGFSVDASSGIAELAFTSKSTVAYRIETSATLSPDSWSDSGLGNFPGEENGVSRKQFSWPEGLHIFVRVVPLGPVD